MFVGCAEKRGESESADVALRHEDVADGVVLCGLFGVSFGYLIYFTFWACVCVGKSYKLSLSSPLLCTPR